MKNKCAAFSEKYGLRAEFYTHDLPKNVPEGISLCLYRVAQECLRNVFKHANATEVRLSLRGGDEEIVMEITDVGVGFDLEAIRGKGVLGLISMEERVRLVNGVFSIRSETGMGTVVRVKSLIHAKHKGRQNSSQLYHKRVSNAYSLILPIMGTMTRNDSSPSRQNARFFRGRPTIYAMLVEGAVSCSGETL